MSGKLAKPPAVEEAISRLVSVLAMRPGATRAGANYAIAAMRVALEEDEPFIRLVNELTGGKSDAELKQQADGITDAAVRQSANAIIKRIKDNMAAIDREKRAEQTP